MKVSVLVSSEDTITEAGVSGSATSVVPEGSIMVVARSGILAHTLPVAIAGRSLAFNQDIKAIQRSSDKVLSEYVYWFLRGREHEVLTRGVKKGATVHSLQSGYLEKLEIPLVPFSEQRRIVELLSRAENLVRMRREAEAKAKEIIPALFLDMFGDPGTNPKGWDTKPIGETVRNLDAFRCPVKAAERASMTGSFPYYGASGVIDFVNGYTHDEPALLVAEDGANLLSRSTPIAFQATGQYWVNNHAHVLGKSALADLTFLEVTLNLRDLREFVTGSAQPKLTQLALLSMPVPVPPMPLQTRFSRRVDELRALSGSQAAASALSHEAFQSLLAGVFSEGSAT
jgi:type I restriction enzyme S subunit